MQYNSRLPLPADRLDIWAVGECVLCDGAEVREPNTNLHSIGRAQVICAPYFWTPAGALGGGVRKSPQRWSTPILVRSRGSKQGGKRHSETASRMPRGSGKDDAINDCSPPFRTFVGTAAIGVMGQKGCKLVFLPMSQSRSSTQITGSVYNSAAGAAGRAIRSDISQV